MKALVAEIDGEIVGCIGVLRERYVGKYFFDCDARLTPHFRSIKLLRALKASMRWVKEYQGPLVSMADGAEGAEILIRLGFTHLEGDLFGWLK